jgi:hypothetical protein
MTKSTKLALLLAASLSFALNSTHASDWAGGGGNWSSDAAIGWNGTGVPNGIGAIANFGAAPAANSTTGQDVAGVIVGTVSYNHGNGNFSRTITLTNALTLNQDSAGAGFATISNTNTNAGASNALIFSTGSLVLGDDLFISNTGASTASNGSIQHQQC